MNAFLGKGNFISGRFILAEGDEIFSSNPARDFERVFTSKYSRDQSDAAVMAAQKAFPTWSSFSQEHRNSFLLNLKEAFVKKESEMAHAITQEMGKPYWESLAEAKNLSARVDLMIRHGLNRVATERFDALRGEARYHAQGPVAILGPYNFPAHLVNAHVIPALLTGNTVVVKPSEVCPKVAQLYAECMEIAGLPPGVFNMVNGRSDVGKALATHPLIRGVFFTGSYATGRALKEMLLDDPKKILALEMGGKNIAVVLDDADLFQALSEIIQGAFLTTGQRCTATSRVFLHRKIADQMTESIVKVTKSLKPSDPFDPQCAFGPLATKSGLERYLQLLNTAQSDTEVLLGGEQLNGGAYVTPSVNLLAKNGEKSAPYFSEELFGPNICIEIIDSLEDAIKRTNESPFGLSNALFTASQNAFEEFYHQTFSGVLNHNRSTNGALGQLPFGGVGKSGNQRAAGIDAVRYATFPVAINSLAFGETNPPVPLKSQIGVLQKSLDLSTEILTTRHLLESFFANRGFQILDAKGKTISLSSKQLRSLRLNTKQIDNPVLIEALEPYASIDCEALVLSIPKEKEQFLKTIQSFFLQLFEQNKTALSSQTRAEINIPQSALLPQSDAMLSRLYKNDFVPKEKKTPVVDLDRSKGPYICSIDEEPLVIFDAASQIASLGVGFQSGLFLDALDNGKLTPSIVANPQHQDSLNCYGEYLLSHTWSGLKHVTYVSSGAEANEKAFDLCRLNGSHGKRIIAFEGSFHGRTLLSLQATYNPQKRGPFEFAGFEATFVPFPTWKNPNEEPEFDSTWVSAWHYANIPSAPENNALLAREISSLIRVKEEIEKGDIACVIVEPMQCEGGDNYATKRFFNGLRALTRGAKVPLIFDEVQTGFGLLGNFYAHTSLNLRDIEGNVDGPDCVTLAKKAQLGVVLSAWEDTRPSPCHHLQVERGLIQAQALEAFDPASLHREVQSFLENLSSQFPDFVSNPRSKAFAFAFDLPSNHLANQVISQRFYRGYMVYIAGEKTMRFRLNAKTTKHELRQLFDGIKRSFEDVKRHANEKQINILSEANCYQSPLWVGGQKKKENKKITPSFKIERLTLDAFNAHEPDISRLEEEAYEPGRRDSMEYLRSFVEMKDGLALFMLDEKNNVIGYAIGGPIESCDVDGPLQDSMRGKNNTFYSTNVLISPHMRGLGLGFALKKEQVEQVRAMKNSDQTPRYHFMSGRNRIDFTAEMGAINRVFGAYSVKIYDKQYGDDDAKALYYRIPLLRPNLFLRKPAPATELEWDSPIQSPFGSCPERLFQDLSEGQFTNAVATKLTLSNWVTPEFIRYAELMRSLAPNSCRHTYFTSGRDEVNDKAVRSLRFHRPEGQVMIGLQNQYFGTTTAVSRSLTDPTSYLKPFSWFDWPLVEHPNSVGASVSLEQIEHQIRIHTPEKVLGIAVELIGEKTAHVLSAEFMLGLEKIRKETGVPIVFSETASALGRNGKSLFFSDAQALVPNMVLWYAGAQHGHVFVDDKYFVSKPLTLISTWDGDEVSIRRTYRHLILALETIDNNRADFFERELSDLRLTERVTGLGLWRSIQLKNSSAALEFVNRAKSSGLRLSTGFDCRVMITPHLGSSEEDLRRGVSIIKECL